MFFAEDVNLNVLTSAAIALPSTKPDDHHG